MTEKKKEKERSTCRLLFLQKVIQVAQERGIETVGELMDELDSKEAALADHCVKTYASAARKGGLTRDGSPASNVMDALLRAGIVDRTLGIAKVPFRLTEAIHASERLSPGSEAESL